MSLTKKVTLFEYFLNYQISEYLTAIETNEFLFGSSEQYLITKEQLNFKYPHLIN